MKETSNPRAYNGTKLTTGKVEQCYFCENVCLLLSLSSSLQWRTHAARWWRHGGRLRQRRREVGESWWPIPQWAVTWTDPHHPQHQHNLHQHPQYHLSSRDASYRTNHSTLNDIWWVAPLSMKWFHIFYFKTRYSIGKLFIGFD